MLRVRVKLGSGRENGGMALHDLLETKEVGR
jgi:hypothetical protein